MYARPVTYPYADITIAPFEGCRATVKLVFLGHLDPLVWLRANESNIQNLGYEPSGLSRRLPARIYYHYRPGQSLTRGMRSMIHSMFNDGVRPSVQMPNSRIKPPTTEPRLLPLIQ